MFGLFAGDAFYLKCDGESEALFQAVGSAPFTYRRGERSVALSYRRLPAEAEAEPERLLVWAERAVGAAKRAASKKSAGRKRNKREKRTR